MGDRGLFTLSNETVRAKVQRIIAESPPGTRVEIMGEQRSIPQNKRMHAMLRDIAQQYAWAGKRRDTEVWKHLFLKALGHEYETIPSLDGEGLIYVGGSSSKLTVKEMTDLIELMFAWGSDPEHVVEWSDPNLQSFINSMQERAA